jgi:hypothetical protein
MVSDIENPCRYFNKSIYINSCFTEQWLNEKPMK